MYCIRAHQPHPKIALRPALTRVIISLFPETGVQQHTISPLGEGISLNLGDSRPPESAKSQYNTCRLVWSKKSTSNRRISGTPNPCHINLYPHNSDNRKTNPGLQPLGPHPRSQTCRMVSIVDGVGKHIRPKPRCLVRRCSELRLARPDWTKPSPHLRP
jgi:hypothetical protein